MIRIAYFAPLLHTGGTQRHLQQLLRLLDPSRFDVRVYTLRSGGDVEEELRATGVRIESLELGTSFASPEAIRRIVRVARTLRAERVDVVHGYQWRPSLVGAIAGRLARVPRVVASKRSLTGDDRQGRLAWRVIGRLSHLIVANAEALRLEAIADGVRARWEIIPNGVDVDRLRGGPAAAEAKAALGLDPARPVVGTLGRLEERKGHRDFIAALGTMLQAANGLRPQAVIVGDGPLRADLERQATTLGVRDDVAFTGSIADVRGPLAAMDVFVLPSRAEGFSNALLEAMATARPVIATAVGGTGEALEGGATGLLVPPGDASALAAAAVGLLKDPARAARLGAAAQRLVTERFSARAMTERFERLYAEP
jgi:glycosyltransferase involved in cell wall biosynthesis